MQGDMRYEEVFFYRLLLICGYSQEMNHMIDAAVEAQNPIDPDIIELAYCQSDRKKQLSVLNAVIARTDEDDLDHALIFEYVRSFLHRLYVKGMDIPSLVRLMYRISIEIGWYGQEPWNTLFLMEDYYADAQYGFSGEEDFTRKLEAFLSVGQPWTLENMVSSAQENGERRETEQEYGLFRRLIREKFLRRRRKNE